MQDPECIFCRIVARETRGHIVDENEHVIVFLSLENHPLVVTKAHFPDIYSLPTGVGGVVMAAAIQVAKAMKQGLRCDGVYLTQANEPDAGQDVLHYHLHLYPCWGDSVRRATGELVRSVTRGEAVTETVQAATAERIRRGLASL